MNIHNFKYKNLKCCDVECDDQALTEDIKYVLKNRSLEYLLGI